MYRNVTVEERNGPSTKLSGEQTFMSPDSWSKFSARYDLLLIREALHNSGNRGADAIWALQDGMYGLSGNETGWDWSAIRDSTPEAIADMFDRARTLVDETAFLADMGLTADDIY